MANPILNENFTENERVFEGAPMTVNGTLQITAFLGFLLVASAYFVWSRYTLGYTDMAIMDITKMAFGLSLLFNTGELV